MPIYEYECTQCGHIEEVLQNFSDSPITQCPNCNGSMKKLMSMNSFHLKGSGWYVTDYASKSKASSAPTKASEGGSDSSEKAKDAGTSSKTESSGSEKTPTE